MAATHLEHWRRNLPHEHTRGVLITTTPRKKTVPPELLTPESMDCRHSDHHNATTQPCLVLLQACPCCHFLREHRLRLRRGSCQQFTRLSWFLQCKMEQMGASLSGYSQNRGEWKQHQGHRLPRLLPVAGVPGPDASQDVCRPWQGQLMPKMGLGCACRGMKAAALPNSAMRGHP